MAGRLSIFLSKMSNIQVDDLPMVHTTPAYNIRRIFEKGIIEAKPCDFFVGENLNYFFFGRPAYKWDTEGDACDWELPVCFVFQYELEGMKRVFPFDTGAFFTRRLPSYLTMMPLEEFEISDISNSASKVVGAFFSTVGQYYNLKCKDEEYFRDSLTVEDIESEVRALHKLYSQSNSRSDDRRAAVEIQFDHDIALDKKKLLSIILPDIYLSDKNISDYANSHSIFLIPYDTFPLNSKAYSALIYQKLKEFYRKHGFIK